MLLEGDMKGAPKAQSSGHPKRPSDRLWPVVRITTLHGWPRALHDMRGRLGDETPRAVDARRQTALRALRMRRPDRRSRGASFDHATARARPPSHGDEAFASTRNPHTARAVLAASGSDIPSPGGSSTDVDHQPQHIIANAPSSGAQPCRTKKSSRRSPSRR